MKKRKNKTETSSGSVDVPPSLRKAGLTKITTNLGEGQKVRLPPSLFLAFLKTEIFEAMNRVAEANKEKEMAQQENSTDENSDEIR